MSSAPRSPFIISVPKKSRAAPLLEYNNIIRCSDSDETISDTLSHIIEYSERSDELVTLVTAFKQRVVDWGKPASFGVRLEVVLSALRRAQGYDQEYILEELAGNIIGSELFASHPESRRQFLDIIAEVDGEEHKLGAVAILHTKIPGSPRFTTVFFDDLLQMINHHATYQVLLQLRSSPSPTYKWRDAFFSPHSYDRNWPFRFPTEEDPDPIFER